MVSNTRTAFAQKIQEKEEVIAKQREEEERLRQEGCILHHHNATLYQQLQETQSEKYAAEEEIEQARNRIRQLKLEDAKSDVKRLTGRTSEVPALEDSLKMASKERDAAMKRNYEEQSKGFEANSSQQSDFGRFDSYPNASYPAL